MHLCRFVMVLSDHRAEPKRAEIPPERRTQQQVGDLDNSLSDTIDRVASLAGCTPHQVRRFIAHGLFDADRIDESDVNGIRLVASFEQSGFPLDTVARLFGQEGISLEFAREMLAVPLRMSNRTYREVNRELGFSADFATRIAIALGVPKPAPDDLAREDDIAFLRLVAAALDAGLDERVAIRYMRTLGRAMRTVSEAQRELFRSEVIEPLNNAGVPFGEFLMLTARKRNALQKIGYEATLKLQARILETLVFDDVSGWLHDVLRDAGMPSATGVEMQVVCFVDLSNYSDFVRLHGDHEGLEIAEALEEIVQRNVDPNLGRVVKTLGDGILSVFFEAGPAIEAAIRMISQVAEKEQWSLHVGMAAGRVISRDGDVYGATVNRAARLCAQAGRRSILIDGALFRQLDPDERLHWNTIELPPLRGMTEARAYELSAAAPREIKTLRERETLAGSGN
jgi:adenylate cyclase